MTENSFIEVLVVDDHEIVRLGLASLFATYTDIRLIGEAANGQEALDFCNHLQPDVILMDLTMPVMDGITATRIISKKYPRITVIVFSNSGGFARIQKAIDAGAVGYIRKTVPVAEIAVVIRAAVFSDN